MATRSFRVGYSGSTFGLIVDVVSLLVVIAIFVAVIYSLLMAGDQDQGYFLLAALVFAGGCAVGWLLLTSEEQLVSPGGTVAEPWPPA